MSEENQTKPANGEAEEQSTDSQANQTTSSIKPGEEKTDQSATPSQKIDNKDKSLPKEQAPEFYDPKNLNLKPGLTVRVHQKIKEKNAKGETKERIQIFAGRIIAAKHGKEAGATITVRKVSEGVGVEKIFPIFSPNIAKIEITKEAKVHRSKLYFLRNYKKRLKEKLLK